MVSRNVENKDPEVNLPEVVIADFRIRIIVDPTQARTGARQVERSLNRVGTEADRTRRLIARAIAFVGVGLAVRQLSGLSDEFIAIQNRVRIAVGEFGDVNAAIGRLRTIANSTRSPLSQMAQLFSRGALAADNLGASQEELLEFTAAIGKGFAIQGASSAQAAATLLQLSQAIGAGIVRGEEFNSILEGGLPIAQAAASGIERFGGSVAALREEVIAGNVTSQEFFRAILDQADELDRQFSQTVSTISQALQILRNNLVVVVGDFNESTGAAATLSMGIIALGNNIERLVIIGRDLAVLIGVRLVAGLIAAEVATIRLSAASIRGTVGLNTLAGASRRAALGAAVLGRAAGVLRGAVAFLGGPLGIATLAAFAIFEFSRANREARESIQGLPESIDDYRQSIVELTEAQLANRNQNLIDRIAESESELEFINRSIDRARRDADRTISQLPPGSELGQQLSDALRRDIISLEAERDTVIQRIEADAARLRAGFDIELGATDIGAPIGAPEIDTTEIDKLREALTDLQNDLDPVLAAQREFAASVEIVNRAVGEGLINVDQRNALIAALGDRYRDAINPARAIIEALEEENRLARLSESERRIQIEIADQLNAARAMGVTITEEFRQTVEGLVRDTDRLANAEENLNSGLLNRNALISREIELLEREAEISRLSGDQQTAARARLNIEERIRQALREANRDLDEDEIIRLARLGSLEADAINRTAIRNAQLQREADFFEEIRGPARVYEEHLQALITLYGRGRISAAEFDLAQRELQITLLESGRTLEEGFQRGILNIEENFTNFARLSQNAVVNSFQGMEDALIAFTSRGQNEFGALVDSIIADLQRILIRSAILGPISQALSGLFGGAFGGSATPLSLPVQLPSSAPALGLADGGRIAGPGTGRSDSILARVSNGEFIVNSGATRNFLPLLTAINSVPGFQSGGRVGGPAVGGSIVAVNVIDQRSSGDDVEVRRQGAPDGGEIINITIRDAVDANIRGGRHDAALRGRYGIRPSVAPR